MEDGEHHVEFDMMAPMQEEIANKNATMYKVCKGIEKTKFGTYRTVSNERNKRSRIYE